MEPVLQLDPERSVCVLGPQLAAHCLESQTTNGERVAVPPHPPAVLSYKGLVELGVRKLLEVESFSSDKERLRRETLLTHTYELEPCFAANKIAESLRSHRVFDSWISQLFASLQQQSARKGLSSHPTIKYLQAAQEKGLRLVYSHYDTVLATALGLQPVLLDSEDGVQRWYHGSSRTSGGGGLLYLHGVCTLPSSLKWDNVAYSSAVAGSAGAKLLKDICRDKSVVFLGFDGDFFDPFLPKFVANFCDLQKAPPLLLSFSRMPSGSSSAHKGFLTLPLQHGLNLERSLALASPTKSGMLKLAPPPLSLPFSLPHQPNSAAVCWEIEAPPLIPSVFLISFCLLSKLVGELQLQSESNSLFCLPSGPSLLWGPPLGESLSFLSVPSP